MKSTTSIVAISEPKASPPCGWSELNMIVDTCLISLVLFRLIPANRTKDIPLSGMLAHSSFACLRAIYRSDASKLNIDLLHLRSRFNGLGENWEKIKRMRSFLFPLDINSA